MEKVKKVRDDFPGLNNSEQAAEFFNRENLAKNNKDRAEKIEMYKAFRDSSNGEFFDKKINDELDNWNR